MSAVAQTTYSGEKYLQMEVKADYKSEYFRGNFHDSRGYAKS